MTLSSLITLSCILSNLSTVKHMYLNDLSYVYMYVSGLHMSLESLGREHWKGLEITGNGVKDGDQFHILT